MKVCREGDGVVCREGDAGAEAAGEWGADVRGSSGMSRAMEHCRRTGARGKGSGGERPSSGVTAGGPSRVVERRRAHRGLGI